MVLIYLAVFLFVSCDFNNANKFEDFSFERQNYEGDVLKVNGYYFHERDSDERVDIIFLYRNGAILQFVTDDSMEELEAEIEVGNKNFNDERAFWGVFKITQEQLISESWAAHQYYPVVGQIFEILADSTMILSDTYGKEYDGISIGDKYLFKEFLNKPDSVNSFIESSCCNR